MAEIDINAEKAFFNPDVDAYFYNNNDNWIIIGIVVIAVIITWFVYGS